MFCEKCGNQVLEGRTTCQVCGNPVQTQAQPQTPPPQGNAYQQPQYQPHTYQPPYKKEQNPTEKILMSIFKNFSLVPFLAFIFGCSATLFSFIASFLNIGRYGSFYGFCSGLATTMIRAALTLFITITLAKINYKDE